MKIYIASSIQNASLNAKLDKYLIAAGFEVFLPQRDTKVSFDQEHKDILAECGDLIFRANQQGIDESDLILVVARKLGTDTAWECGYAYAKQKKIVILEEDIMNIQKMYMVRGACTIHQVDFSNESCFKKAVQDLVVLLNDYSYLGAR